MGVHRTCGEANRVELTATHALCPIELDWAPFRVMKGRGWPAQELALRHAVVRQRHVKVVRVDDLELDPRGRDPGNGHVLELVLLR